MNRRHALTRRTSESILCKRLQERSVSRAPIKVPPTESAEQLSMQALTLKRWSYRLSAVLAVAYAVYVVVLKVMSRPMGGPLGDLGEFLLVSACITAFGVGLFADEAQRDAELATTNKPGQPGPSKG